MSMNDYFLARMIIEDRMREANQLHLAREVRRSGKRSPAAPAARKPRRLPRLWRLVHLRHTYS
jgi:hypothetical protein